MTLTGTTTLDQSGPGSNGNEGVLHFPKAPNCHLTTRCNLVSYSENPLFGGGLIPELGDIVIISLASLAGQRVCSVDFIKFEFIKKTMGP